MNTTEETTEPEQGTDLPALLPPEQPIDVAAGNKLDLSLSQLLMNPTLFKRASAIAAMFAGSDLVPKAYRGNAANVFTGLCLATGVGCPNPLLALGNIGNVNGKPTLFGDLPLGLVRAHPEFAGFREWFSGSPMTDDWTAHCEVKRLGRTWNGDEFEVAVETRADSFSVADAKTAQLWAAIGLDAEWKRKLSPWVTAPKRMLMFRARGFALRDLFGDALQGLGIEGDPVEDDRERSQGKIVVAEVTEVAPPLEITKQAPDPVTVKPVQERETLGEVTDVAPKLEAGGTAGGGTSVVVGEAPGELLPREAVQERDTLGEPETCAHGVQLGKQCKTCKGDAREPICWPNKQREPKNAVVGDTWQKPDADDVFELVAGAEGVPVWMLQGADTPQPSRAEVAISFGEFPPELPIGGQLWKRAAAVDAPVYRWDGFVWAQASPDDIVRAAEAEQSAEAEGWRRDTAPPDHDTSGAKELADVGGGGINDDSLPAAKGVVDIDGKVLLLKDADPFGVDQQTEPEPPPPRSHSSDDSARGGGKSSEEPTVRTVQTYWGKDVPGNDANDGALWWRDAKGPYKLDRGTWLPAPDSQGQLRDSLQLKVREAATVIGWDAMQLRQALDRKYGQKGSEQVTLHSLSVEQLVEIHGRIVEYKQRPK